MSEHTPGPWKVGPSEVRVDCEDGTCFVIWPNARLSTEEIALTTRANARLIAAAPDLLEALEEIVNNAIVNYEGSMDVYSEAVDAARAAIAKAKGGA